MKLSHPKLEALKTGKAVIMHGSFQDGAFASIACLAAPKNREALNLVLHLGSQFSLYAEKSWIKNKTQHYAMHSEEIHLRCTLLPEHLISWLENQHASANLLSIGADSLIIRPFENKRDANFMLAEDWIHEWMSTINDHGQLLWVSPLRNSNGDIPDVTELQQLADQYDITLIEKEEVLTSRTYNPSLIEETGVMNTKLKSGDFKLHSFYSHIDQCYHWAFAIGDPAKNNANPLVRIESECLTGHVFGSLLCDCGNQLKEGLEKISESGCGILIYLRQEGRGIGLLSKIKAYKLQQDASMDTVDANLALGMPEDARDYVIGAQILNSFGIRRVRLMTNNPSKVEGLEHYNIEVSERVSHIIPPSKHNKRYLATKKKRMGHLI